MGNGTSKEEKQIAEIAAEETKLECPVLVDLGHGTIRHRHEEIIKDEADRDKLKIGYFYHPRLNDFSEDASITNEENNRLKYVFKGPSKDAQTKLYYIYGTKPSDKDKDLLQSTYKPQGIGYNWPESYRKANNLYYDVTFDGLDTERDETMDDNRSNQGTDTISEMYGIISEISPSKKENIILNVPLQESVSNIMEMISIQILVPTANIHFLIEKNEINVNDNIVNYVPQDLKIGKTLKINMRLI